MEATTDNDIQEEVRVVESALVRLAEERQRILYRIRKALVSDDEGDAQLIATGHERDTLHARKASLEAKLKTEAGTKTQLSAADALLRQLQERADSADAATKRQVVETLVKDIIARHRGDGEISLQITYRFEGAHQLAHNAS